MRLSIVDRMGVEDEAADGSVERRNGEIGQEGCRGPFSVLFGAEMEGVMYSVADSYPSVPVVAPYLQRIGRSGN